MKKKGPKHRKRKQKIKSSMCIGKVKHKEKISAIIAAKKLNNAGISIYKCQYCQQWHLGKNKRKIQNRIDQILK